MTNQFWKATTYFFTRPVRIVKAYQLRDLGPDLMAALSVAVVLLPQGIAHAMIAELPPQMGLYTAVVAAIAGALWGSSNHLQTGTTNAASLLVLATLLPIAQPGTTEYIAAAGLMAVMVGVFRMSMGLAKLGILVNFVSDSVIIGFNAGAGLLIGINQFKHLLRLDIPSNPSSLITLGNVSRHIPDAHLISLAIGVGVILVILLFQRFKPTWPAALISMTLASVIVASLGPEYLQIEVVGELPRSLPPIAKFPLDWQLIANLSTGALAIGAIGLVEAIAISRSIASQSGQRIDSNQEFVGQGMASIASGIFSGYTPSGSFTRSAVNYNARGRTPMSAVFSGLLVLASMLLFAHLTAYVPRAGLAGVLMVTAYRMVDRKEMFRIWHSTRGDAVTMATTFLATVFLPLQFAVLTGILISLAVYILRTSVPQVVPVLPAANYHHFTPQGDRAPCPQLAIFDILGDLYFGAVNHIEETLRTYLDEHPRQRYLLLRMTSVHQCDISGLHMLENITGMCATAAGIFTL